MLPWDGIIPDDDKRRYEAAGYGQEMGLGHRPALLIIDVQYRTISTAPQPFWESIKEFPTSCGDAGWSTIEHIERLLKTFRQHGWPVMYPHVAPKEQFDQGRLAERTPPS